MLRIFAPRVRSS